MLYGILLTIFVIISALLIVIILLQQGKGGLGLGALGSSAQMIFGGSGGQDVFQKTTWILGALFMSLSLVLALKKTKTLEESGVLARRASARQAATIPNPPLPAEPGAPETLPTPQDMPPVQSGE